MFVARGIVICLTAAIVLAPIDAKAQEIPAWYHNEPRSDLIAGGALAFGLPYLVSILTAAGNANNGGDGALWVPVVGPFVQMGSERPSAGTCDQLGCYGAKTAANVALADVFLVVDGALQVAGVAMVIVGLLVPRRVSPLENAPVARGLRVVPTVGRNVVGLGVTAPF